MDEEGCAEWRQRGALRGHSTVRPAQPDPPGPSRLKHILGPRCAPRALRAFPPGGPTHHPPPPPRAFPAPSAETCRCAARPAPSGPRSRPAGELLPIKRPPRGPHGPSPRGRAGRREPLAAGFLRRGRPSFAGPGQALGPPHSAAARPLPAPGPGPAAEGPGSAGGRGLPRRAACRCPPHGSRPRGRLGSPLLTCGHGARRGRGPARGRRPRCRYPAPTPRG